MQLCTDTPLLGWRLLVPRAHVPVDHELAHPGHLGPHHVDAVPRTCSLGAHHLGAFIRPDHVGPHHLGAVPSTCYLCTDRLEPSHVGTGYFGPFISAIVTAEFVSQLSALYQAKHDGALEGTVFERAESNTDLYNSRAFCCCDRDRPAVFVWSDPSASRTPLHAGAGDRRLRLWRRGCRG